MLMGIALWLIWSKDDKIKMPTKDSLKNLEAYYQGWNKEIPKYRNVE